MNAPLLFVYGTLRPGFDDPMALWLREAARHVGPATARGRLYRVDSYPAFVPGRSDAVTGDLFALVDPMATLAILDDYEECAAHFPQPHEYRRERLIVRSENGPVEAWTYIYNRDVGGLARIESGDFLA
ncbi:gamma-glutamylcyclotransferase [Sphingobium sp. JS3065]|uniref:gamma-glutamylcyclotransferase family protein n=1 Tax=Sphingobium sp. JS3065 TaxID=2970925 RepID=UPI002264269F|nr:gamma-glutamylcyclotransferase family protein [Sphingobium sp. JS3065]UZW56891.1 gamma-glutamylcyclotransferase [Sphingobium sp. JS3065]